MTSGKGRSRAFLSGTRYGLRQSGVSEKRVVDQSRGAEAARDGYQAAHVQTIQFTQVGDRADTDILGRDHGILVQDLPDGRSQHGGVPFSHFKQASGLAQSPMQSRRGAALPVVQVDIAATES